MRTVRIGTTPGVIVMVSVLRDRLPSVDLVAAIDGVQPHRHCEQEGVPASAVPLLRGDWRLRQRPTAEVMTDDGTQAAQ